MADTQITVLTVTVTPGVRQNVISWTVEIGSCLPYMQLAVYQVYASATNNRTAATKIGDTTDLRFTHTGLLLGVARYYWVRAKDQSDNLSDFVPLSTTGGVVGIPVSTGTDSVGGDEVKDGSLSAAKLDVDELSAISGNMGTLTLGRLQSADAKMIVDLTNKRIKMTR